MSSSDWIIISTMGEKLEFMFQTTNQLCIYCIYIYCILYIYIYIILYIILYIYIIYIHSIYIIVYILHTDLNQSVQASVEALDMEVNRIFRGPNRGSGVLIQWSNDPMVWRDRQRHRYRNRYRNRYEPIWMWILYRYIIIYIYRCGYVSYHLLLTRQCVRISSHFLIFLIGSTVLQP